MKYEAGLRWGPAVLSGAALVATLSSATADHWLLVLAEVTFGISLLIATATPWLPMHRAVGLVFDGYLRARLVFLALFGAFIPAFVVAMLTPLSRLPSLLLYLPFLLLS